ncbi:MAG: protein kinase domain-containing protein [Coleofasciculus sp.]
MTETLNSLIYCINPNCQQRQNPNELDYCQACGTPLLINNRYRLIKPLRDLEKPANTELFEVEDWDSSPENWGTLKVIKVLQYNHPDWIRLFKREARILIWLRHPGIPKVEPDGYFSLAPKSSFMSLHCLVMEHIPGQNLQQWLAENGRISEATAIEWLHQLVEIIDNVHQNGLFHRDIKPSNIMLRPNGQLVLIDFGTVKEVTPTQPDTLEPQDMTRVISEGYSAPEQIEGSATPQSDFFALGRTLVHLLTGRHPTEFETLPESQLISWRDYAPQISQDLANFIDGLMTPLSEHRPENTQTILACLEKQQFSCGAEFPVNPTTHSATEPETPEMPSSEDVFYIPFQESNQQDSYEQSINNEPDDFFDVSHHLEKSISHLTPQPPHFPLFDPPLPFKRGKPNIASLFLARKGENSKPLSLQERGLERGFPDPVKSKDNFPPHPQENVAVLSPVNCKTKSKISYLSQEEEPQSIYDRVDKLLCKYTTTHQNWEPYFASWSRLYLPSWINPVRQLNFSQFNREILLFLLGLISSPYLWQSYQFENNMFVSSNCPSELNIEEKMDNENKIVLELMPFLTKFVMNLQSHANDFSQNINNNKDERKNSSFSKNSHPWGESRQIAPINNHKTVTPKPSQQKNSRLSDKILPQPLISKDIASCQENSPTEECSQNTKSTPDISNSLPEEKIALNSLDSSPEVSSKLEKGEAFQKLSNTVVKNQTKSHKSTAKNPALTTKDTVNSGQITILSNRNYLASREEIPFSSLGTRSREMTLHTEGNIQTDEINPAKDSTTSSEISASTRIGTAGRVRINPDGSLDTSAGTLNTSFMSINDGVIALSANNNISTGDINSSAEQNAGAITLTNGGNIIVSPINAQNLSRGRGGNINAQGCNNDKGNNINITASQFFRVTDTFTDANDEDASLSSGGGDNNGDITIRHSSNSETVIGNTTINGTVGMIADGDITISPTQSFLFTHIDDIEIISVDTLTISDEELVDESVGLLGVSLFCTQ